MFSSAKNNDATIRQEKKEKNKKKKEQGQAVLLRTREKEEQQFRTISGLWVKRLHWIGSSLEYDEEYVETEIVHFVHNINFLNLKGKKQMNTHFVQEIGKVGNAPKYGTQGKRNHSK